MSFPHGEDAELEALEETCALDVAAQGGVTLERAGELLGLTRERVRQIEAGALGKLAGHELAAELAPARRRLPLM